MADSDTRISVDEALVKLITYAQDKSLICEEDSVWALNTELSILGLASFYGDLSDKSPIADADLEGILTILCDDACERGIIEDTPAARDRLDTNIMGALTARPSHVIDMFWAEYGRSAHNATNWFFRFNQDVNYIRRSRVAKDLRWQVATEYGDLDITINLAKPEKDPKDIAAAQHAPHNDYPRCLLCRENEGYAGRIDHPARQNLRMIPLNLADEPWFFQYSPYAYYNEHCIVLSTHHVPMHIDRTTFDRLLEFVSLFPAYFIGSNADLPIVGGSVLSHDHFQGGRCTFAMTKAPLEDTFVFKGFEDVEAGIVRWPMSVIRLTSIDPHHLSALAEKILTRWRTYSDEKACIVAFTDDVGHNTITPIARQKDGAFELDLVLRNNLTTEEHPYGVFHPHAELHHIKKENIGLIEVMGLAVLPARLKDELNELACALMAGEHIRKNALIAKHADWAEYLASAYTFTAENVCDILKEEVGQVFVRVLEQAGVFKRTPEGHAAFMRFIKSVSH